MYFSHLRCASFFAAFVLAQLFAQSAFADVTTSGDTNRDPVEGQIIVGELIIGEGDPPNITFGTMVIDGGSTLNNDDGIIGEMERSFGDVEVSGRASLWDNDDLLVVGDEGRGTLTTFDRSVVNVTGDTFVGREATGHGVVDASGFGTTLVFADTSDDDLNIGHEGFGVLQVTNSAHLISRGTWIGRMATGNGLMTLRDIDTQWINDEGVVIGDAGVGELEILDGATAEVVDATLGDAASGVGHATVVGLRSVWRVDDDLIVGDGGEGLMNVLAHGRVESSSGSLGMAASARGTVVVSGTGSTWEIDSTLSVGLAGAGRLHIESDGLVDVGGVTTIGSEGRVIFAGSRLQSSSITNGGVITGNGEIVAPITNSADGEIRAGEDEFLLVVGTADNSGRIEALGGEIEFRDMVENAAAGQIALRDGVMRFEGDLDNDGIFVATFGVNDVFGAVSNSASGTLLVAGDARTTFYDPVTNAGTLTIEPDATAVFAGGLAMAATAETRIGLPLLEEDEDAVPLLESSTSLALDGSLIVSLENGLVPVDGDVFPLISAAGGLSGEFDTTMLPALSAGLTWSLGIDANSLLLSVLTATTLAGDYNGNGQVEQADLDLVLLHWGSEIADLPAIGWINDLPTGAIDQEELDGVLLHWGESAAVPVTAGVPEPSTTLLIVICWLVVIAFRREIKVGLRGN